jgi:hypothetical protein
MHVVGLDLLENVEVGSVHHERGSEDFCERNRGGRVGTVGFKEGGEGLSES